MAKKNKTVLDAWQKKAREGGKCERCGIETPYLTVDHIIPLYILDCLDETGFARYEDSNNFQMLCRPCNVFKGSRIDKRHPKTKEIILKYL